MVNTPMPHKTRTLMATLVIFLSVLSFSGQPIIVAWGDGNSNPFLFNSAWRTGLVFGGLAFLLACYRQPSDQHRPNFAMLQARQ